MKKTMCQVCGREIKAKTGLIAHHGYRRPYQQGWQTASCLGAQYEPYEVSCERLREVVERVKSFIASQEEALVAFLTTPPQTITVIERLSSWSEGKEVVYQKPETFNPERYYGSIPRTYECAYSDRKYDYERTIKAAKADLSIMERRLSEWKPVEANAS
jgi:phage-related protein